MSPKIVVLTKAPRAGRVKTRLAQDLGDEVAARIHELLVMETLRRAKRTGLPVTVSLALDEDDSFSVKLSSLGVQVEPQCAGDLGQRLRHALRGEGIAIALGTDCVTFQPDWLLRVHARTDAVYVGPADDGGYWCIAVDGSDTEAARLLFEGMPWSEPTLLQCTERRLREAGRPLIRLPSAYDIDRLQDLERLLRDPACSTQLRQAVTPLL